MPIPKRTQERYQVQKLHKLGDRLRHKPTGDIFVMGTQRNVYECYMMRISPMGRAAVSWRKVLEEFEKE